MSKDISTIFTKEKNERCGRKGYFGFKREKALKVVKRHMCDSAGEKAVYTQPKSRLICTDGYCRNTRYRQIGKYLILMSGVQVA